MPNTQTATLPLHPPIHQPTPNPCLPPTPLVLSSVHGTPHTCGPVSCSQLLTTRWWHSRSGGRPVASMPRCRCTNESSWGGGAGGRVGGGCVLCEVRGGEGGAKLRMETRGKRSHASTPQGPRRRTHVLPTRHAATPIAPHPRLPTPAEFPIPQLPSLLVLRYFSLVWFRLDWYLQPPPPTPPHTQPRSPRAS